MDTNALSVIINSIKSIKSHAENKTGNIYETDDGEEFSDDSLLKFEQWAEKELSKEKPLTLTKNVAKSERTNISYFVDGARLSSSRFQLGLNSSISISQVSICCCKHEIDGTLRPVEKDLKFFLTLHDDSIKEDEFKQPNQTVQEKLEDVQGKSETPLSVTPLRATSASDPVQEQLRALEMDFVKGLNLTADCFLMKDGRIVEKKGGPFIDSEYVVGVSKSFNHKFPQELINLIDKDQLKTNGDRTRAVWDETRSNDEIGVAVWFLKLRNSRVSGENKYGDIVRCELMRRRIEGQQLKDMSIATELIDKISRSIIDYAYPVPYGQDSRGRWRTHLYPIFLTETYCKSQFYSKTILNHIISKAL